MNKVFKPLLALASVLAVANINAAVVPMNDFEDGTIQGWHKGGRAEVPITVGTEANGNSYLRYVSNGPDAKEHDRRVALIADKNWRGNYTALGATAITARMKNNGPVDLDMHAAFGNNLAELRTRYATEGEIVAADGQWHDVVFSLTENVSQVSSGGHGKSTAAFDLAEVLANIVDLRFTHGELGKVYLERRGPFEGFNAGEEVIADLWIDDITITTSPLDGDVSAVPVPGAVWLFMTAIAGLSVSRKRKSIA